MDKLIKELRNNLKEALKNGNKKEAKDIKEYLLKLQNSNERII